MDHVENRAKKGPWVDCQLISSFPKRHPMSSCVFCSGRKYFKNQNNGVTSVMCEIQQLRRDHPPGEKGQV